MIKTETSSKQKCYLCGDPIKGDPAHIRINTPDEGTSEYPICNVCEHIAEEISKYNENLDDVIEEDV